MQSFGHKTFMLSQYKPGIYSKIYFTKDVPFGMLMDDME